ncbi:hypothetical protein M9H77_26376 [Catharanthus roseus]|uniref:Uncharacterized protein n=1 Tax=Catharanthus roseus TaxID=4058 RepID=A0ACC0A9I6_CATRO|nr:hypothetical protein M9H77_26376 [Catharanthus roseus]
MGLTLNHVRKIILQGGDGIIFEVDEAVAKQFVTIKHMIEDSLTSRGPILLPKVPDNILTKFIEYCMWLLNHPPTVGCCGLPQHKWPLPLACEDVLDMIKRKDPKHIHKIFNITSDVSPEEEERSEGRIRRLSNNNLPIH